MQFALGASSSVKFRGEHWLHACLQRKCSGQSGAKLALVSMARRRSCMPKCHTPRRNSDVEQAIKHFSSFMVWANQVNGRMKDLFSIRSDGVTWSRVDHDGCVSDVFVPVLPLLREALDAGAAAACRGAGPRPVCYAVRCSDERSPEGTLAIEEVVGPGGDSHIAAPIVPLCTKAASSDTIQFALGGSSSVRFRGERYLHACLQHNSLARPARSWI